MLKVKYSNVTGSLQRNRRNKVIPNIPNVDKSEHLNKLLTSTLKHIVVSTLHYQNEFYVTDER